MKNAAPHDTTSAPEIAHRLKEALGSQGWSVTELVDRLKAVDASVKGSTAVFHYTSGKKVPPIRFVEEAADILGVRPSWLAFGEGPRRPEADPDWKESDIPQRRIGDHHPNRRSTDVLARGAQE